MAELYTPVSPESRRERGMTRRSSDRAFDGAGDGLSGNGHDTQASIPELLKEAFSESTQLLRSELQVFKLEMQQSARAVVKDTVKIAIGAVAALLGGLCFMAFLVLGLGALLTNVMSPVNAYWVSALALAAVFSGVGGLMIYRYSKRVGDDVKLPETQAELERDRQLFQSERHTFREAVRP